MKKIRQLTYGLCAAWLVAPLATAQIDCGDAVIVSSGDTLSDIAKRCGTSVRAILAANAQLADGNSVRAGTLLSMPDAEAASYYKTDAAANDNGELLPADAIDELVAPIALYPDVLLAEMLPASTYPIEIVQAARWREENDNVSNADEQDWAPSIKALTRYPDALAMLNEDLDWTVRLGDAFLAQPDDIFDGIQRMRKKAEAAGNLRSTDEQKIVREQTDVVEVIRIVPAQPRYVYVPYYDPYYIYYPYHGARVSYGPSIRFSARFELGGWNNYALDWRHRHIYHHAYDHVYYGGHNRRVISRVNNRYPANTRGLRYIDHDDRHRWTHDRDRGRRHGNHVVNTQPRDFDRGNRVVTQPRRDVRDNRDGRQRDATRRVTSGRDAHTARSNRLEQMRGSNNGRQPLSTRANRQNDTQRQLHTPVQRDTTVRVNSNNRDRTTSPRDARRAEMRRDRVQVRDRAQVVRSRNTPATAATVNRANRPTRRAETPRAVAQPRVDIRRAEPRASSLSSSTRSSSSATRSASSERREPSRAVRTSNDHSERISVPRERSRNESRGGSRADRIREQRR